MGSGASTQSQPKYKWEQDHVLRGPWTFLFKEKVQCACEGSKWCTRENPAKQRSPNALLGLHSNWVGERVLAMARPWQSHVEQYDLVAVFQRENIGMILNLQELGEHASCGPGNLPNSGFTYDPEVFMAGGVGYYNFSWRDMGVPSLDRMMDIVQVMDFVTRVEGRRIAVHCHAGLGRTGLAIACFFIFTGMYDNAQAAIEAVRKHRQGAVQTSKQVEFVTIFGQYLQHLRCVFPSRPLGSATGGGFGGSGSLETRSAPPATGEGEILAPAASLLPQENLLESKETGSTLVGVYSTGLTVTVPLLQSPVSSGALAGACTLGTSVPSLDSGSSGYTDPLTEEDLGLQTPVPWNDAFHIQPQHAKRFRPAPPRTYTEALARQGRLLHGPERRALLRLHKVVKEAVFVIISAAQAFQPPDPTRTLAPGLPVIPENETGPGGPFKSKSGGSHLSAAAAAASLGAGTAAAPSQQHPLPRTFAHVLALLLRSHGPTHLDSAALTPLAAHPAYVAAVGHQVDAASVLSTVAKLREELSGGRYEGLRSAPLLAVVMCLDAFFDNFAAGSEPASLTPECLRVISSSYQTLFDGQMPAPPNGSLRQRSPQDPPPPPGPPPQNEPPSPLPPASEPSVDTLPVPAPAAASGAASEAALEVARQAYDILEPLPPLDFELLLLFAALLRFVARSSGPGCEEAVVEMGGWVVGMLLGRKLAALPEASEALLSFLWYLAGRDEAYAMLVLLKRQRIAGTATRQRAGTGVGTTSGSVDLAAMLAAQAAALVTPPAPPPTANPPSPAGAPLSPPRPTPASTTSASVIGSEGSEGCIVRPLVMSDGSVPASPSLAASSMGAGSPHFMPQGYQFFPYPPVAAAHLAQLLTQDLQLLYRSSFREALAGISTVVYPPPPSTGRIEVHDVWR